MKTNAFYKLIFFVSISLIFFSCTPIAEISRNPRKRLDYRLYILPYTNAPTNTGFEDIDGETRKIDGELEDALIESIYDNFKNKKLFKTVIKVNNINNVPNSRKSLVLFLNNEAIMLDKSVITIIGEIKTNISIKKLNGDIIINKNYLVKAKSTFGTPRSVALKLYKKIINDLMNQIEIKLGGLPSYTPQQEQTSPQVQTEGEGDFWM